MSIEKENEKVLLKISSVDGLGVREQSCCSDFHDLINICMGIVQFVKDNPMSLVIIKDIIDKLASGEASFEVVSGENEFPDFNEILKNAKVNPNNNIKEN